VVVAVDVGAPTPVAISRGLVRSAAALLRDHEPSLRTNEVATADIAIRPDVGRISSTDFASRKVFIAAGFLAAQRLGPVILERLAPRRDGGADAGGGGRHKLSPIKAAAVRQR
jgi:hypothetical protein